MTSWLRVVLAGLLALSVVLHGNAGNAFVACATPPPLATAPHGAHAHHSEASMHADHVSADASLHGRHNPGGSTAQAPDSPHDGADATHAKCSACAACCVAAIPSSTPSLGAKVRADSFAPVSSAAEPVFLTGGPERPPRRPGA